MTTNTTTAAATRGAAATTASGDEPNIAAEVGDEPNIALDTDGGADTGQPDTGHEADHATGTDVAGTGENGDRARRLLWLDPRTLAVHPRNVRDDLGASLTAVAKTTGLGRKRVAKAAGIARLDRDTAAAVDAAGLTLDQAAAVAVFADDPATAATLIHAAEEGPGRFAHARARVRQAREEAEQTARLAGELAAAGRTVLDETDGERATPISRLAHDGAPLTAEAHAGCPGAAVTLVTAWDGPQAVEVCTDPATYGHASRWPSTPLPGGDDGGEPTEEQREAVAAGRRDVVEGNKAMVAANATRREWVKALLQRRTAPKAALRFTVDTLATDPRSVARWLSGSPTPRRSRPPPTSAWPRPANGDRTAPNQ